MQLVNAVSNELPYGAIQICTNFYCVMWYDECTVECPFTFTNSSASPGFDSIIKCLTSLSCCTVSERQERQHLTFLCSLAELQDLRAKLKDALNACKQIAASEV